MEQDNSQFQSNAVKWLFDQQLVDDPVFINNLNIRILVQSRLIKNCQLLIVQEKQQILVYVELKWLGKFKYFREGILNKVSNVVTQILPNYANRVVDDKSILDLSILKLKEALGGHNANTNVNYYVSDDSVGTGQDAGIAVESSNTEE